MNERKQQNVIAGAGIVLLVVGTLGTVIMFMAKSTPGRLEDEGMLGQLAAGWAGLFGLYPSMFLNAAFVFLGARLFLKGGTRTLFRDMLGSTMLAIGLAIFFGALSSGAGGRIGAITGEMVSARTHLALGALVGDRFAAPRRCAGE